MTPIVREMGVEIYDVEYVKEGGDWYLRAYIDKPDGVSINDCEAVSRALSDELDREDFIPDAYILEISSPGLGRTLKKDKHLQKSLGEEVEIRLYKPIEKRKEFIGILDSFDEERITILEEKEQGAKAAGSAEASQNPEFTPRSFKRSEIALVRLTIDF